MNKPLTAEGLKPCPCGSDSFYMPVTIRAVPEDVTCCRCRRGFNPYTGEYIKEG